MPATHGLSHLALAVRDPQRSLDFYSAVFGVKEYYRDDKQIQVLGPGQFDVLAFEQRPELAGQMAGVLHFGFRLQRPGDLDAVVLAVEQAGGKLLERGMFTPAEPYAFVSDPDGYVVEIWFE